MKLDQTKKDICIINLIIASIALLVFYSWGWYKIGTGYYSLTDIIFYWVYFGGALGFAIASVKSWPYYTNKIFYRAAAYCALLPVIVSLSFLYFLLCYGSVKIFEKFLFAIQFFFPLIMCILYLVAALLKDKEKTT